MKKSKGNHYDAEEKGEMRADDEMKEMRRGDMMHERATSRKQKRQGRRSGRGAY